MMDLGDLVYFAGLGLIGYGCGMVRVPYGLIAVGTGLVLPHVIGWIKAKIEG